MSKVNQELRRAASVAAGDFAAIFGEINVPTLSAAAVRVMELCGRDDTDLGEIVRCIETDVRLTTDVLRLANSAVFAGTGRAVTVRGAVTTLGLRRLRGLTVGWAAIRSLPQPEDGSFDPQEFWSDSLWRALTARGLASVICPAEDGVAFTGALLADAAIPTLLCEWSDHYAPVHRKARGSARPLARLEDAAFGWNHAQAGAWIARHWGLPDELVCAIGFHHASESELAQHGLERSAVSAVALASQFESPMNPTEEELQDVQEALDRLYGLDPHRSMGLLLDSAREFDTVADAFGIRATSKGGA